MKKLISALAAVVALGATSQAHAAGFQLDVVTARGTGMAGSMTAAVDDASASFYNPAGLARGQYYDLEAGLALIVPSFSFTPASGGPSTSTDSGPVPPPGLFAAWGPTDELALGIGEFTNYGNHLSWPESFPGRYLIRSISLQNFTLNPTAAFKIGDRVRVGIGVQIVRSIAELTQDINFIDSVGSVDLGADTWGAGGNLGLQVDIMPKLLTFGAAYRSPVDLNFTNGLAHFSNIPIEFANTLKDQPGTLELVMPQTLQFGLSSRPIEPLLLDLDVQYTGWQTNSAIVLSFEDPQLSRTEPKNWTHSWNYRIGAEYKITPSITVRGGLLIDPTPSPTDTVGPDLPDASRVNIALGGRYTYNDFKFDLGYQLVLFSSVTTTNPVLPGDYKGLANVISLTVSYGNLK
ncbi:MAG: outer membrane protein transport protein [Deltaproteobacteria bacterium]|nr:outer membrane protein transport protein [Deltaproteobacteria bacterium]